MHFPDGFTLCKGNELWEAPEEPKPPLKPVPKTRSERLQVQFELVTPQISLPTSLIDSFKSSQQTAKTQPNLSPLKIKRSNSYDVTLNVVKLKQRCSEQLEPVYVIFNSFDTASSFEISYRINAANVPQEINGSLVVKIQKEAI